MQAPPIVLNVSEKEALTEVLNCLGSLEATYSNKLVGEKLFIGSCKISIGDYYGTESIGRTKITGEQKCTPYDAECSAEKKAIHILDRNRGFEIVDFNYDIMVSCR